MYSSPDLGMNALEFLGDSKNAKEMPAAQQELFTPEVAEAAGMKAAKGAELIRFLVMCGTEDVRLPASKAFAENLTMHGYKVETAWPKTQHGGREKAKYKAEFEKYPRMTVDFFKRVIRE